MMGEIEIREARPEDLGAAIELLENATLPVADLDGNKFGGFLVATMDDVIAGLVGLEQFGPFGLLRSLVVAPEYRDAGLGRKLVAELEARAAAAGIREMWLLTIDADSWFETVDYARRDRSTAPAAIASTEEFTSLCPGSAVLMSKPL